MKGNRGLIHSVSLLLLIAVAQSAFAGVIVSKDYDLSPDVIGVFESKVKWAQQMRERNPNQSVYADITDEIGLFCTDRFPTARGEGCKITFRLKAESFTLTVIKISTAFGFAEKVASKLASLNPATHDPLDRIHFGSPFVSLGDDATDYSCQASQTESGPGWKCTLHVSEEISIRN